MVWNGRRIQMLTPEQAKQAVKEFKVLFKQQYGVDLSEEEATEKVQGLLSILSVAFKLEN